MASKSNLPWLYVVEAMYFKCYSSVHARICFLLLLVCLWCFLCFYSHHKNAIAEPRVNFATAFLPHTHPHTTRNIQASSSSERCSKTNSSKKKNRTDCLVGVARNKRGTGTRLACMYVQGISHTRHPLFPKSVNRVRKGTWRYGLAQEVTPPPNRRSVSQPHRARTTLCFFPFTHVGHVKRGSVLPQDKMCAHACTYYEKIMPLENVSSRVVESTHRHNEKKKKQDPVAETRTGKRRNEFKNESAQKPNNIRKSESAGLFRYERQLHVVSHDFHPLENLRLNVQFRCFSAVKHRKQDK